MSSEDRNRGILKPLLATVDSSHSSFFLLLSSLCSLCLCSENLLHANPPVASYVFPAGGQRGTTVDVRVGGLNLYTSCGFELLGPGVAASKRLHHVPGRWFEGPLLPLPESQQAEDYPRDMAGQIRIRPDAPLGLRHGRLWTAEGAASGLKFMVGDLPEILEQEIDGDPLPVEVQLPVTINGRIFPRQDIDIWSLTLGKGQTVACEVHAARLGSPLDSRLEVRDPTGRVIAENDDAFGADSFVRFTAAAEGKYQVRIQDANLQGGPAYIYRLTLTEGPRIDRVYPLGGRRGSTARLQLSGQGVPAEPIEVALPADGPRDFLYRHAIGGKQTNPVLLDLEKLPEYLEAEPNDSAVQAKEVALPAMVNGRIDQPGDVDYWNFTAKKGEALALELRAAQLGSPLQGVLTVQDVNGKELARAEGTATQADPVLRLVIPAEGTYSVRVADRFRTRGGPEFAYRLRLTTTEAPGFRLRLATDALTLLRGGSTKLKITAERVGGFKEAIALSIAGLPSGIKVANSTIAAKQMAVDMTLTAEAAAAIGEARLKIQGSAPIAGQTVTQTATLPGPQGSAEIESVLLAVALPVPFKIVGTFDLRLAPRGTVFRKQYRIERGGYEGPLEIRLADRQARHLQGVTGPTILVPPGVSEFEYPLTLPPWMEIGRTSRTCVVGIAVIKEGDAEYEVGYSSVHQNEQIVAVTETGRLGLEAEKTTVMAERGKSVAVPVRISRDKGLNGPVKVELILGEHVHGVTAEPVLLAADQTHATLTLHFAQDKLGPLNQPAVLRAMLMDKSGPLVAETKLEIVPEP